MASEGDVQYFIYTAPLIAKNNIEAIVTETPVPESTAVPNTTLPPREGGNGMDMGDFAMYAIVALFIILVILMIILIVYRSRSENRYRQAQKSRTMTTEVLADAGTNMKMNKKL